MIPVLWLCGPPGVGKTAVAWEIHTRLAGAGRPVAYVDVDQVGMCSRHGRSDPDRHELKARNTGALRANFGAAGAGGLVVSGVVDGRRGPETALVGGGDITVCRLRADPGELVARLARRSGSGAVPDAAVVDADLLDRSTFADAWVDTTGLSVGEVADRVSGQIGDWPPAAEGADPPPSPAGEPRGGDVVWVCGPTGVGKSTVGFQVYLSLLRSGRPAAYVDVDQLGFCAPPRSDPQLRARNLAALWANFHAAGARTLVAVGPVATSEEAAVYEEALPGATFAWCRLHAGRDELTARILSRRSGGSWSQPGDPLRDGSEEHLLAVADRAALDAQDLERHGHGTRIPVDRMTPVEAAGAVLEVSRRA